MSVLAALDLVPEQPLDPVPRKSRRKKANLAPPRSGTRHANPQDCSPRTQVPIEALIPQVGKIASWLERRWGLPAGWDHDDLVAEGLLALVRAARKYDPSRPCSLSTYSGYWIRGLMFRALTERWTQCNNEAPPPDESIEAPWPPQYKVVLCREVLEAIFTTLNEVEQALVFGRLDGDTISDLARRLSLPITTAYRQHERALRRVRVAVGAPQSIAYPS